MTPLIRIVTKSYKIWQAQAFRTLKALKPIVRKILKKRMDAEILKYCEELYRNPWFLVKKSNKGKYRLINAAIHINRYTIRNTIVPPNIKKFAEKFAEMQVVSLLNI